MKKNLVTLLKLILIFSFLFFKNNILIVQAQTENQDSQETPSDKPDSIELPEKDISEIFIATPTPSSTDSPLLALNPLYSGAWAGILANLSIATKNTDTSAMCIECNASPQCGAGQVLLQRTCLECAHCSDISSVNLGTILTSIFGNILTSFGSVLSEVGNVLTSMSSVSSSSGNFPIPSNTPVNSSGSKLNTSSGSFGSSSGSQLSSSSSSGGNQVFVNTVSDDVKSKIIILNLKYANKKLTGTVQIGNIITDGTIINQKIISEDEAVITVKDKSGKTAIINLKLIEKTTHVAISVDGISIDGKNVVPFYSYLIPTKSPEGSFSITKPQMPSATPKPKSVNKGRPGGTGRPAGGRAGGDKAGRPGGNDASGRAGGDKAGRAGGDDVSGRAGGDKAGRAGGDDEVDEDDSGEDEDDYVEDEDDSSDM